MDDLPENYSTSPDIFHQNLTGGQSGCGTNFAYGIVDDQERFIKLDLGIDAIEFLNSVTPYSGINLFSRLTRFPKIDTGPFPFIAKTKIFMDQAVYASKVPFRLTSL